MRRALNLDYHLIRIHLRPFARLAARPCITTIAVIIGIAVVASSGVSIRVARTVLCAPESVLARLAEVGSTVICQDLSAVAAVEAWVRDLGAFACGGEGRREGREESKE